MWNLSDLFDIFSIIFIMNFVNFAGGINVFRYYLICIVNKLKLEKKKISWCALEQTLSNVQIAKSLLSCGKKPRGEIIIYEFLLSRLIFHTQ